MPREDRVVRYGIQSLLEVMVLFASYFANKLEFTNAINAKSLAAAYWEQ